MTQRRELSKEKWDAISLAIQDPSLSLADRSALRLRLFLEEEVAETPNGSRMPCVRTILSFPDIYAPGEKERLTAGHYVHEQGRVCNISSDWCGVIRGGLLSRREGTTGAGRDAIDAVIAFADRFQDEELSHSVRHGANGYICAMRLFRLLHFCLWASNVYHNTVGRFDQYMYPFYARDMQGGSLTPEDALSATEDFFLSFNRDSDLYQGMQQGDNGQSLMLGGCDRDGACAVNELTYLCLRASLANRKIDPKINLRVDKNTPIELYRLATELTKTGLGFPQYANDDAVIPALVSMGYELTDARDYTVAACWEFIIPGVAMDIPNIGAVCLAEAVRDAAVKSLAGAASYGEFFGDVCRVLQEKADEIELQVRNLFLEPAPFQSVLMADWTHDVSQGAKYNNYGIHGTGFATAVDELCAIRQFVYEEGSVSAAALARCLEDDFASDPALGNRLRVDCPRLGRDDNAIPVADALLSAFADSLSGRVNERGGLFRAGTGSAMYYLWHGRDLGATADGRKRGEMLSANFSPSLLLRDAGPLSVLRSMARPGLSRVMNGGPVTLEIHDTVFRNPEGAEKVAMLVRSYIALGGHQLQLNAVSRDTLLDAQAHPELHKNLIVRVWGWSGHFIQLDKAYQDQIIERNSYQM